MPGSALIGIIGGYGAVGRAAARRLQKWRVGALRLGGRHPERAAAFAAEELGGQAEVLGVDYRSDAELAAFCSGCRLVLNCAGPSYRILDRIARAAFAAGADYVDSYGDDPTHERLAPGFPQPRTAILSAGVMPGMAGLLPRWLAARGFERVSRLLGYVGGLERVTPAAAADYLLSLGSGYGESLAGWRDGRPASKVLAPLSASGVAVLPRSGDGLPLSEHGGPAAGAGAGPD